MVCAVCGHQVWLNGKRWEHAVLGQFHFPIPVRTVKVRK